MTKKELSKLQDSALKLHNKEAAYKTADNMDFYFTLLLVIVAVLALRLFVFEPVRVDGPSMNDTLYDGDRMLVEKVTYWFHDPQRYDVIICHYPEGYTNSRPELSTNTTFVKRVIGLPGEYVKAEDNVVYVSTDCENWERVESAFVNEDYFTGDFVTGQIPEDSVFVMGDHRNNSTDSRYVGTLKLSWVVGKVRGVLYPFDSIREVH